MTLQQYKDKQKMTWDELGLSMGLTGRILEKINANPHKEVYLSTAIKIQKFTGLMPFEYLDYCNDLKKLFVKNK